MYGDGPRVWSCVPYIRRHRCLHLQFVLARLYTHQRQVQQSVLVHHSVVAIWRQYTPLVVQSLHPYAIVSLLRTEIVQCREHQRYRVLIVVQVQAPCTAQCSVQYSLAVQFGCSRYVYTVHHQLYQLGIYLKVEAVVKGGHCCGIKLHHMVQSLHYYRTVRQSYGLSVFKHLVGHTVVLVVTIDERHTSLVVQQQHRYAVAGSHPDVAVLVFYYRVYNVVIQSFLLGKHLRQHVAIAAIQLQSLRSSHPCPSARILIHAVRRASAELLICRHVVHHRTVAVGSRVAPFVQMERYLERSRVQQSAFLGTNPHTTLAVECYHVYVCMKFFATEQFHSFYMCGHQRIQVYHPVSVFACHIHQRVLKRHIVKMIRRAQYLFPLVVVYVVVHQYGLLVAVAYLVHLLLILRHQRRCAV